MEQEYADFDVLLERRGEGVAVRVVDSPVGGVGPEEFVPPDITLTTLVDHMGTLRRLSPASPEEPPPPEWETPKTVGIRLFNALFTGQIRFALHNSLFVAAKANRGLRLRLRFADTPKLASLPWELLYDDERRLFPCRIVPYPTVRLVDVPHAMTHPPVPHPIRMLVVISSPADLHPLDVDAEWARIQAVMQPLVAEGRVQLVPVHDASFDSVRIRAKEGDFRIFHFMGHGGVNPKTGEGQLAFTGPGGLAQYEPGSHLADVLTNSPIELAVLNSCEGGRVTAIDPYGSTAMTLVESGIPAVVAMQFAISDIAAQAFSGDLYQHVTKGGGVEFAVTLGRQAILATSSSEWATPVLYQRSGISQLFPTPVPPPPPPPPPPTPPPESPPAAPRIVSHDLSGSTVNLSWYQPPVDGVAVTEWVVTRNGAPHAVVYQPSFRDTPGGPGVVTYAVVAQTADRRQSSPSAEATIRVRGRIHRWFFNDRGRPRALVWSIAGFWAFFTVLAIILGANPLPAPTNVEVVSTNPVVLEWNSESSWRTVAEWRVYRDGELVGSTTVPRWQAVRPVSGTHRYSIQAVGSSGDKSPLTTVTVGPSTTPSP